MIVWYEHLFYKNQSGYKVDDWKKKVESGKCLFPIYCVCLPSNPANLLDIMSAHELLFPYYKKKKVVIVGLASNREAAILLAAEIVNEVYNKTGDFDISEYLLENRH